MHNRTNPSITLGILLTVAILVPPAAADLRLDTLEASWSIAGLQKSNATRLSTYIQGTKRRIEARPDTSIADSAIAAEVMTVQIDRIDRDTTFFLRPTDNAYIVLPMPRVRQNNRDAIATFLQAQRDGTAPADTIAPISVTNLHRKRRILGVLCDGVVVDLPFQYSDSTNPGNEPMKGVLSDTVWLAPPGSEVEELFQFEKTFAKATLSDSFLATPTDIQLSQWRNQGLVGVLQRAVRRLPGYPLATHFVNLLTGMPPGLTGVERKPDGSIVVQRARREPVALVRDPIPATMFEVPKGLARVERGKPGGSAQTP
ncbi:MAG: hypothetical protein ACREOU_14480 [Candidatus Eiseniibacteriota bacterium]